MAHISFSNLPISLKAIYSSTQTILNALVQKSIAYKLGYKWIRIDTVMVWIGAGMPELRQVN